MTSGVSPTAGAARRLDRRAASRDRGRARALLPAPPAAPAVIADAMRYSVRAGGKRLRPLLALAAAEAVGARCRPRASHPTRRAPSRCPRPARSSSSTPTRSCTTICRPWTTTCSAAGSRRCTSCTARAWPSSAATRCSPRPSRSSRASRAIPALADRKLRVIARSPRPPAPPGWSAARRSTCTWSARADRTRRRGRAPASRAARHARAQDGRAHPRRGGRGRDHGRRRETRSWTRSTSSPPSSGSRSRSSTTSSTSRARPRRSARPPGKDAAAGKLTYPALVGLDASRTDGARRHRPRRRGARAGGACRPATCSASPTGWSSGAPDQRMKRIRLDTLLVERGLAPSRERARALILAGQVRASGHRSRPSPARPSTRRPPSTLLTPDHPYVGRGGLKLAHALDTFAIEVDGRATPSTSARRRAASPTSCCSAARARGRARRRPRTRSTGGSGTTACARARGRERAPPDARRSCPGPVDIVTIDVSFISLRLILPAVPPLLRPGADVVALVKPQFEAGREEVGARRPRRRSGRARARGGRCDGSGRWE